MVAYSFQDVVATISGPGGVVPLGYGAGTAEEGITIERAEDKDTMTMGADGTAMHTLHSANHGTITVRILKTSPANALLQAMYDFQILSSANWGNNVINITHIASGDSTTGRSVAFRRASPLTYAKEGNINEWSFNVGDISSVLGLYTA